MPSLHTVKDWHKWVNLRKSSSNLIDGALNDVPIQNYSVTGKKSFTRLVLVNGDVAQEGCRDSLVITAETSLDDNNKYLGACSKCHILSIKQE